jgi:hypothetical protein
MEIIESRNDSVDLDLTFDELIIFRNSLTEVLSNIKQYEFHARLGFTIQEIEKILNSVNQAIKKIE